MRRSLAPSELQKESKRPRFTPPFLKASHCPHDSNVKPPIHQLTKVPDQHLSFSKSEIRTDSVKVRSTQEILRLIDNIDVDSEDKVPSPADHVEPHLVTDSKCASSPVFPSCDSAKVGSPRTEPDVKVADEGHMRYFSVVWTKLSTRKHKKWEGDAVLIVKKSSTILKNMEGKTIGQGSAYKKVQLECLEEGSRLVVGGKEVEILGRISSDAYCSGRCFQGVDGDQETKILMPILPLTNKNLNSIKKPMSRVAKHGCGSSSPRYDPLAPGALVLPRPSQNHQWIFNKSNFPVVDVVVDPALSQKLRPHQREGVIFMYECITNMRKSTGEGVILADEMGLGKTLQCITLIWTLLKQGPYGNVPILKRVLIVTPSSLMKNWMKEFHSWLGREKLNVFLADQSEKIEGYVRAPMQLVLITSYDLLLRHHETLQQVRFDLMICDEGHRLKNSTTKTAKVLTGFPINKRIVLTGTPIQNDLQEFYALVEFCNPGTLGSNSYFKRVFEDPILLSKQQDASTEQCSIGQSRTDELFRLTAPFVLRRTQDVNNAYLPPKDEYVVFCKPTKLQLSLYQKILESRYIQNCIAGIGVDGTNHLKCITLLRKLCNHPGLLYEMIQKSRMLKEDMMESMISGLESIFPSNFQAMACNSQLSGKTKVLIKLLEAHKQSENFQKKLGERMVLVSSSTKMLDLLETMCKSNNYSCCRLDGSTPTSQRQALVDRFNSSSSRDFVFLLSSKAGGVGLNLTGASRIVLLEVDWNPANDLQAMSRVWRDGQKRRVHIYRLVTTGTLEEKIYQRQIIKQNLSGALGDSKDAKMQFSQEDLRDLFKLHLNTPCNTHDLLECFCCMEPSSHFKPTENKSDAAVINRPSQLALTKSWQTSKNLTMDQLMYWEHIHGENLISDTLQTSSLHEAKEDISFVFHNFTFSEVVC